MLDSPYKVFIDFNIEMRYDRSKRLYMKLIENTWDHYYLNQLDHIKIKSKDPSTKVSAIIVGKRNQVISHGFNGFAQGVNDNILLFPERYERPLKYELTIHAELNSIILAGRSVEGCKMYCSLFPCISCANIIIQSGIVELITWKPPTGDGLAARWDFTLPKQILNETGIRITEYEHENEL